MLLLWGPLLTWHTQEENRRKQEPGAWEKTQEDTSLALKYRSLKSSNFSELFWALFLVPRGPVQSIVPQSSSLACEDGPRRLGQTLSEEPGAELADRG